MAKKTQRYFYTTIVICVFLIAAGLLAFYGINSKGTGNAAQSAPVQKADEVQRQPDIRTPSCEALAENHPDQKDFFDTCMNYFNKFCFSSADCGPFSCVSNKCQVS